MGHREGFEAAGGGLPGFAAHLTKQVLKLRLYVTMTGRLHTKPTKHCGFIVVFTTIMQVSTKGPASPGLDYRSL